MLLLLAWVIWAALPAETDAGGIVATGGGVVKPGADMVTSQFLGVSKLNCDVLICTLQGLLQRQRCKNVQRNSLARFREKIFFSCRKTL
jgi:hypothetical protein